MISTNIKKTNGHDKGFTLLELLIVISIIAILSVALVLVLNPAEALKKSRDAQRISDLATLKTAIGIYLTSTSSPVMSAQSTPCSSTRDSVTTANYTTGGSGWIDINFDSLVGGSPISNLPQDPVNNATYAYQYKCNNNTKTFEISALLESDAYKPSGVDDKGAKDGGTSGDTRYEVGTNLAL